MGKDNTLCTANGNVNPFWISTMENNVKILQKVKLELPYDPAI